MPNAAPVLEGVGHRRAPSTRYAAIPPSSTSLRSLRSGATAFVSHT